jgi:hypothetical protein
MEVISLGIEAVWSAQRCSRELADSVWSVRFYKHLLDLLANDTWRSYSTEAFGRPCQFDRLSDFLTHPDGLGWPSVPEVLEMIHIVSRCNPPPPPRKNEPADPPITRWAAMALDALGRHVTLSKAQSERRAAAALSLAGQFAPDGNPHGNLDNIKVTSAGDGGTSSAYLAARLKKAGRDDLLEQIGPGKTHRSVRAAAIAAGII